MNYLALLLLAGVLLISSGCVSVEKQLQLPDGRNVYLDNVTGEATLDALDSTGVANAPLTETVTAPWLESLATAGGAAPSPWGGILGLLGGTILSGLGLYYRSRNKKHAGLLKELVGSIEDDIPAKTAAKKLDHSPGLKAAVAELTA